MRSQAITPFGRCCLIVTARCIYLHLCIKVAHYSNAIAPGTGVLTEAAKEFALAEYHEAANAYFKGVDIGYTTVRAYITMNVLFAALISAVSESQSAIFASGADVLRVVPILAIVISFTLMFALPYYFRHLENCRLRCEEIEKDNGGKLFTRLGSIAHARNSFSTAIGLVMIIFVVLAFWVYFALRSYNLSVVDIFDATKHFIDSLS